MGYEMARKKRFVCILTRGSEDEICIWPTPMWKWAKGGKFGSINIRNLISLQRGGIKGITSNFINGWIEWIWYNERT